MDQLHDSSLIELAQGGDQHAFAELYSRYFDPVYDFVARMTRNRDEAADIAQDTFLKAMNALGGLQKGSSFKSWIFTIARNTALNRLEKNARTRPLTFESEDGEEVGFDVVDSDRFSDPEEAAQASAVASLVWEAAAGLDPKQLSLLDLHLRQGLDSGEIADVLGVTKNNGYVMLNRLKKAVEESIGAFIMFKDGRQYCDDLDSVLKKADIQGMSPETRKVVERHVALCPNCEERKKKLAPLAAFAAFGAIGAPAGAKAHILEGLMQQWPGPAATGGGASGGSSGGGGAGGSGGGAAGAGGASRGLGKLLGGARVLVPALGGVAALLVGVLFLPQSPLAILKDEPATQQALIDAPGGPAGDPTQTGGTGTATASPTTASTATGTATASPSGSPSPSATAQGQATSGPAATPTQTNTPAPTPGPRTPTFTPSPTATRTPTPTRTPAPTVTPTPTQCVPVLSANTDVLNIAPGGTSSFTVQNGTACPTTFSAAATGGWLSVPSGGTLGPSASFTVAVSVNAALVPAQPGTYTGTVLIVWGSSSFTVSVTTTRTGAPPVISAASGSCNANGGSFWQVAASDDGSVASVVVQYTDNDNTPITVTLNPPSFGTTWTGSGPGARGGSDYRATAVDNVGLSTTLSFSIPRTCA